VVSEYTHEQAVADGVNVGCDALPDRNGITKQGPPSRRSSTVDKRDRLTRAKRWEQSR
jgi:type I restriction enzyme R subunit